MMLQGEDLLVHVQWLDRTNDQAMRVEDDFIVLPDEAVFQKVQARAESWLVSQGGLCSPAVGKEDRVIRRLHLHALRLPACCGKNNLEPLIHRTFMRVRSCLPLPASVITGLAVVRQGVPSVLHRR